MARCSWLAASTPPRTHRVSWPPPRLFPPATLLPDGKVLVAGGLGSNSASLKPPLASAALYDPGNGSWTATGNMVTPRFGFTATLLPPGKGPVAGGRGHATR